MKHVEMAQAFIITITIDSIDFTFGKYIANAIDKLIISAWVAKLYRRLENW